MKNILLLVLIAIFFFAKSQTISITNNSGTNSITCWTQSINMTASSVGFSTASTFTWVSSSATLTGSNVNITSPSTYTVMTMNGNAMVTQTFAIYQNTVAPVSSMSSTFLTMTGTVLPTVTMTAINPTVNIHHEVYEPTGGTVAANSTSMTYTTNGPGTYTHCIFSDVNGCKSCKTFTVSYEPTSLVEYIKEEPLKIYQNNLGEIYVSGAKESVFSLYNLSGQCLTKFKLEAVDGFRTTLGYIKPGVYILVSELDRRKLKVVLGSP